MGVPGYDINWGFGNLQPDAVACRESCRLYGPSAKFFGWLDQDYQSRIYAKSAFIIKLLLL